MRALFTLAAGGLLAVSPLLSGCDAVGNQLGIETPAAASAKREADAKAIGGACRHAGRAIEDCYTLNPRADKAAIYAGWREMNEYMAENKIEPVAPVLPPPPPPPDPEEEKARKQKEAAELKKKKKAEAAAKAAAEGEEEDTGDPAADTASH